MEDARSGEVSTEQLLQELNAYQDAGVDVARLVSGFAVAVAGGDVDTAVLTGGNAAENNALCGGACIGVLAVIVAGYTTYSGDGDPMQGLAVIGSGDDPLSQAVAAGTSAAVEWSATKYPDQTAAVLGVLEATGNAIDATVTYVDDATGNEVSKRWNEIPEHTRNQIKGGVKIASIFVPPGSIKAIKQLITARKLPGAPDSKTTIGEQYAHHKAITNRLKTQLKEKGYQVSDKEISFGSSCGTGRCRPDIVYVTPDGKIGIIEVKTGNAGLTIRQSEIYPQINSGDAIPRGDIARGFDLEPGVPLKDQGYPNGIPIEIRTFPGVEK